MRCISGCLTGSPLVGAWSPTSFITRLGSIFDSALESKGANSMTRNIEPLSGGEIEFGVPIGFVPRSSLPLANGAMGEVYANIFAQLDSILHAQPSSH